MSPQLSEIRKHLNPGLAGRTIYLSKLSNIFGRITEVTLEGNHLAIKTEDTHMMWWHGTEYNPCDLNEFSGSIESVEDSKILPDGSIVLRPWGGYTEVCICPQR